jgi:PAS domain S-box-containing protein
MEQLKILILEDSPYDVELIQYELKKGGIDFVSHIVETKNSFIDALNVFKPDVIISDHTFPQFSSIEALEIYRSSGVGAPFILVTGTVSEEFAAKSILNGASDYILKSNLTRLPNAITNLVNSYRLKIEKEKAQKEVERMNVFLNQVINSQPIILYVTKIEATFSSVFISDNIQNITGYQPSQFLDNPNLWCENIHPEETEFVMESFRQIIVGGGGDMEYRWKCANGTYKWFVDNFTVIKDENNQKFIHGARIDITKLKNADLRKIAFTKGVDEMLFMISHKVRHSISQILGITSLIEEQMTTEEELKKLMEYMKEPARSLDLFTKELTDLMSELKKRNNHFQ